jgi:hypothetical protein
MSTRRTSGNRRSVHAHCQQPRPSPAKTTQARDDSRGGGFPTHRVYGARVGCTCRRRGTVQGVRRSTIRRGGRRPIHTLAGGSKHAHNHGDSEILGADRRALLRYQQTDSLGANGVAETMHSRATEDARLHRALGFDSPLITQESFIALSRRAPHAALRAPCAGIIAGKPPTRANLPRGQTSSRVHLFLAFGIL